MNENEDIYEELVEEPEEETEKPIPGTRQRPSRREDGKFDGPPYGDIQVPGTGWW